MAKTNQNKLDLQGLGIDLPEDEKANVKRLATKYKKTRNELLNCFLDLGDADEEIKKIRQQKKELTAKLLEREKELKKLKKARIESISEKKGELKAYEAELKEVGAKFQNKSPEKIAHEMKKNSLVGTGEEVYG